MSYRPARWVVIRTEFRNTIVWNIPGQIQDAMLQMEEAARELLPLVCPGGKIPEGPSNERSRVQVNMEINGGGGIFDVPGALWWIKIGPEHLVKVFPDVDLYEPVNILPSTFTAEELRQRIDTFLPPFPKGGPSHHGVTGGVIFLQANVDRYGFGLSLSDGVPDGHRKFATGPIYLKEVEVSRILTLLKERTHPIYDKPVWRHGGLRWRRPAVVPDLYAEIGAWILEADTVYKGFRVACGYHPEFGPAAWVGHPTADRWFNSIACDSTFKSSAARALEMAREVPNNEHWQEVIGMNDPT